MTALLELLRRTIAVDGPLPIDRYMAMAMGHPQYGYYITRDPLGARGDFTTAPEISQIFGELVGIWAADTWSRMGRPERFRLIELGPGRGTLMWDALRAASVLPDFTDAARLHLVETSPALRDRQREALAGHPSVAWHDRLTDVPAGPTVAVANEFFDALPVRQFQKTTVGWRERLVAGDAGSVGLRFVLSDRPDPTVALAPGIACEVPDGSIVELCPSAQAIAGALAGRVVEAGGAALIIDYGHVMPASGDTLQAVRGHRYADPLAEPGEADLTAHVDFAALAAAAGEAGAAICGPVTQSDWLGRMGIAQRAKRLRQSASPRQAADIDAAVHRLTADDQMGQVFKVMSIASPSLAPTAGFSTAPSSDSP